MPNDHPRLTLTEKATPDAWKEAQRWEAGLWNETQRLRAKFGKNTIWRVLRLFRLVGRYRGDDWNLWWRNQFEGYRFLPPSVDRAIEVGCGPYTNMRHIIDACRPSRLVLSDPLIGEYRNYQLTFLQEASRQSWCQLDDHPLESLPFVDHSFDLVVMINVLDHVQDAPACMQTVLRILAPGGWLVIGQDLTDDANLAALAQDPGLVGHPIKLPAAWFDPYLDGNFLPAMRRILSRSQGRTPAHHCGTLLFAGRRSEI